MEKIKEMYLKYKEIINYLIFGVLTTVVAVGSKLALLATVLDQKNGLQLQIAELISWVLAVLFAYITNKKFVFKSNKKGSKALREAFDFVKGRVATQLVQMFIMWFFVTFLKLNSNTWVVIFTLVCQVMQIVLNYVISKFLVFKKS